MPQHVEMDWKRHLGGRPEPRPLVCQLGAYPERGPALAVFTALVHGILGPTADMR
jgi:hypothetical protein